MPRIVYLHAIAVKSTASPLEFGEPNCSSVGPIVENVTDDETNRPIQSGMPIT